MSGRGNGPRRSGRTVTRRAYTERSSSRSRSRSRTRSKVSPRTLNVPRKGLQLNTATSDEIVATKDLVYFSFGRFQPPTKGHKELIDYLESKSQEGADAYLFVSSNEKEPKRNPLTGPEKLGLLKKMYPGTSVKFITAPGVGDVVGDLKRAYGNEAEIHMVIGEDRGGQFDYIAKRGVIIDPPMQRHENVISGTIMRKLALGNTAKNTKEFSNGIKTGNMTNENMDNLREVLRDRL